MIDSLGIILFELFSRFGTQSERAGAFRQLRQQQQQDAGLPGTFQSHYPEVVCYAEHVMFLLVRSLLERL
jgi:hypothetical protein